MRIRGRRAGECRNTGDKATGPAGAGLVCSTGARVELTVSWSSGAKKIKFNV